MTTMVFSPLIATFIPTIMSRIYKKKRKKEQNLTERRIIGTLHRNCNFEFLKQKHPLSHYDTIQVKFCHQFFGEFGALSYQGTKCDYEWEVRIMKINYVIFWIWFSHPLCKWDWDWHQDISNLVPKHTFTFMHILYIHEWVYNIIFSYFCNLFLSQKQERKLENIESLMTLKERSVFCNFNEEK